MRYETLKTVHNIKSQPLSRAAFSFFSHCYNDEICDKAVSGKYYPFVPIFVVNCVI
jgi:hypothetical protein